MGKNGKENIEGLKTVQLSTNVVTLLYSTLLADLPVKGSILLDFFVFIAKQQKFSKFQVFQYFSISIIFEVIFGASMQYKDTTIKK